MTAHGGTPLVGRELRAAHFCLLPGLEVTPPTNRDPIHKTWAAAVSVALHVTSSEASQYTSMWRKMTVPAEWIIRAAAGAELSSVAPWKP
ncbi:hypothetical protein NDU88_005107 [Pleurodeles waltl]|uniref:Uncharacterized protein n=1 Tax=Pleurodeles waltl TaxID=8319 RepID=A0AAV7M8Z8_PLEWA|nr:hypothetical protein NDU88_005107 [Pleurodeles waltl]